jgi:hypothetical protein
MRTARWPTAWLWLWAWMLVACSKETRECQRELEVAQKIVLEVDSKSTDSVDKSLRAVEGALAACEKAERWGEHKELLGARNQLRAHLDHMRSKAADPARRKLTPEQVDKLVKQGDTSCPDGQGYKHAATGKEIRCTGPQIVEMSYAAAREYFDKRGYKLTEEPPATLKAEYGAERYELSYQVPKDDRPPRCFTLHPPPEMSWQEATARVTGVSPERLKPSGTVRTKAGPRPLLVQAGETKSLIRIGECGG